MKMIKKNDHASAVSIGSLALVLVLAGCSKSNVTEETQASTPEVVPAAAAIPVAVPEKQGLDAFFLEAKPEGAISVLQARSTAVPGEPIVVAGQIGAAHKPFGESFATLVMGDEAIDYCNEIHGDDGCPTPWDACCEDPDKVSAGRASVQFLADGKPVEGSLKGVGGLTELDHIVVTGVVDPSSTESNLIINASGLYRESE